MIPDVNLIEYHARKRCNSLVISWTFFRLDKNIARSVLFLKSTRDIWKNLDDRLEFFSITQFCYLEQMLAAISQGKQSVSEFYNTIKALCDNLDDV